MTIYTNFILFIVINLALLLNKSYAVKKQEIKNYYYRQQVLYHFNGCFIQRDVTDTCTALGWLYDDLLSFSDFHTVPAIDFLHRSAHMENSALKVDIAVDKSAGFTASESGIQHQEEYRRLLILGLTVAVTLEGFGFE